jgi:predicted NACHT family NTPase
MYWDVTYLSLPLASPSPPPSAIDPTVLAALITAIVALLAAFISAGVALYQLRRNARLEKEKLTAQLEIERERIRYQDQINAARADQERQRQRREMSDEEARAAVERAQTMTERVTAYRDALCADPHLSQLQILDMNHPMPVDQVFVRVRLHQEAKPSYELDPILLKAERQRDPNELLRVSRLSLETRASTALDPEEAIRNYHRCVVVGDPGAGKTTLLKHLALKAAKCQFSGLPDFPIHIELSAFAGSSSRDLLDFISTRWEYRYGFPKADARRCIEEHLQTGTATSPRCT